MGRSTLLLHAENSQTKVVPSANGNSRNSKKRGLETFSDIHTEPSQYSRDSFTPKRIKTAVPKKPLVTPKANSVDVAVWAKAYRKAFPTFLFYFDEIEENVIQDMRYQIQRLGGKIEPFFSSKVTHLIICQNKSGDSKLIGAGKPSRAMSFSSPSSKTSKTATASKLAQNAGKWGIKVWTTQKLFNILRHLLKSPMSNLSSKPLDDVLRDEKVFGISPHSSTHVHYLRQIYLLVEDTTKTHKPIAVREYLAGNESGTTPWPKLYRNTEGKCPFIKYDDDLGSPKTSQARNKLLNRNIPGSAQVRMPASCSSSVSTSKSNPMVVIPKKPGYCENCQAKFDDLEEHVQSSIHSRYASDHNSYMELDALLDSVTRKVSVNTPECPTESSLISCSEDVYPDDNNSNEESDHSYPSDEGYVSLQTISESDSMYPNTSENTNSCSQMVQQYNVIQEVEGASQFPDYRNERKSEDFQVNFVPQYQPNVVKESFQNNIEYEQVFHPEQFAFYDNSQWVDQLQGQFDYTYQDQPVLQNTNCMENQPFADQHYTQTEYDGVPTQDEIVAAIQQLVNEQGENAHPASTIGGTFDSYGLDTKFESWTQEAPVYSLQEDYQPTFNYPAPPLSYVSENNISTNKCFPPNNRMSIQDLLLTDVSYFINNEHPVAVDTLIETWFPHHNNHYI
ncbi:Cdc7p-Dbf4p kinase complex regulatory subunit [Basidiobolus ranarum]|uniref:Cdc7p-Dbf4p kinase complex regulatory subunit n=1 Tax=Basidiobolus ranarum TaxID=34480 RepID=A0ABR2W9K2_9FUNG